MGKRKRNKKNKKRNRYNKKQFVDIFCTNCDLCLHSDADPFFCYEESYALNAKGFTNSYKNLLKAKEWLQERGETAANIDAGRFEVIFCDGLCGSIAHSLLSGCELLTDCYEAFQNQIKGNSLQKKEGKQKRKLRRRYVFKPYPTTFTSDNEDWKNRIEEILADGDSDRQQDKIEESSSRAE